MSVFAPQEPGSSLCSASGVANAPWFAAPVNSEEDQSRSPSASPGRTLARSRFKGSSVWGDQQRDGQRPMRLCALRSPIVASAVEKTGARKISCAFASRRGDRPRPAGDLIVSDVAHLTYCEAELNRFFRTETNRGGVLC